MTIGELKACVLHSMKPKHRNAYLGTREANPTREIMSMKSDEYWVAEIRNGIDDAHSYEAENAALLKGVKAIKQDTLRHAAELCGNVHKSWGSSHDRSALECSLLLEAEANKLSQP